MADFDKIKINGAAYNVKDSAAQQQISAETSAREEAVEQLSQQISAETSAREEAVEQLSQQISAEIDSITATIGKITKSVIDYGAKGDGTADDTEAFMQSLSEQNTAIVPPGTYILQGIALTAGQSIYGCGRCTILKAKNGSANPVISVRNADGVVIKDMVIDANNTATSGIYMLTTNDCIIDGVRVQNATDNGFHVDSSWQNNTFKTNSFINCFSTLNGLSGWYFRNSMDTSMIACDGVSNGLRDQTKANLWIEGGTLKVANCHFWQLNDSFGHPRVQNAIVITSGADECEFVNCNIEGSQTLLLISAGGVSGEYATRNKFVNCMFYNPFGPFSIYNDGPDTQFCNCSFYGATSESTVTWNGNFSGEVNGNGLTLNNCFFAGAIVLREFNNMLVNGCICDQNFATAIPAAYLPTSAGTLRCADGFKTWGFTQADS